MLRIEKKTSFQVWQWAENAFLLHNRSYKAADSHAKLKNVYIKLIGRNCGMVVIYKAQEKTAENFKNRVDPKIQPIAEERCDMSSLIVRV